MSKKTAQDLDKQQLQALINSSKEKLALQNISLTHAQFTTDEANMPHPGLQSKQIACLNIARIKCCVTKFIPKNQNDVIVYLMSYRLVVMLQDSDGKIDFAMLSATKQAAYLATSALSKDEKRVFGQFVGIDHVWPYLRKYAQGMLQDAGFPHIVLPMGNPKVDKVSLCKLQEANKC